MFDDEITAAVNKLLERCKAKALTVATAESCTGGLVAAAISEI
ncbi:MAG TPA: CinA family protein, partial [Pseudolabrys sp.]|nr:CinA family protein [Pseudolabrys sp.]